MDSLILNKFDFIFVLLRLSVIFTFGVFFGDKRIPKTVKTAFIFLVAVIVAPTLESTINPNMSSYEFTLTIMSEVMIGVIIGLTSTAILNSMSMAGSIIDMQGGFGMAQVFDPTTQSQTSIVSQFLISFGLLFFIVNDFHITFLELAINSFKTIPIGYLNDLSNMQGIVISSLKILVSAISIGVCMALPIIGIIFMVDAILGIATRTMPQINIFSVGYIVKIMTTMILLYFYTLSINVFIRSTSEYVFKLIERLV